MTCTGSYNKNIFYPCLLWLAEQLSVLIKHFFSVCGESEEALNFMTKYAFIIMVHHSDLLRIY